MLFQGLEHIPIRADRLSAIRFAEGFVVFKNLLTFFTPPLHFQGVVAKSITGGAHE